MLARRRAPEMPSVQTASIPAPIGGLNTVAPGFGIPELDCISLYNMVSAENGLRSRLGSREWVTGLTGAADNYVRTMLTFKGSTNNGSQDRAFAVTSSGIWDVTSSTAAPSIALAFLSTAGSAGYGVAHATVTTAGHFLFYADEVNGLHIYTETTGLWTAVTALQITGIDPANIRFVHVFKNKVFFAVADSADAWYLDSPGAIFGAAVRFPMGRTLKSGGHLVGMWSLTYDGGAGMDDSLVALGAGGNVAIFDGTDISSSNSFSLRGVWDVAGIPSGRDLAMSYGGDLLILTKSGLLSTDRLVKGRNQDELYATNKVANLFNSFMLSRATLRGWSIRLNPEDNTLLVTVPTLAGQATEQLAMSVASRSWGRYDGLNIYSSVVHAGKLYYGTVDGKVGIHDGYIDGVTLADPNAYTAIQWRCLTAFRDLGSWTQKQMMQVKTQIISETSNPPYAVQARYRYDLSELAAVSASAPGDGDWDVGLWDTAVWGDGYNSSDVIRGLTGCGTEVAIAVRGAATSRTILVGFKVAFTQGGML